eukprot:gene1871-1902_t
MSETMADGPGPAPEPSTRMTASSANLMSATPGLSSRSERRQRRALQGVAFGFSLLVVVCLAAGLLAWKNSDTAATVMQTYTARQSADFAMEQMLLAESSQRGFLLTRDQRFMPAYRQGLGSFKSAMADLKAATQGNAELSRLSLEFERLATAKFQELDQTIALAEAGQIADALALVQSGIGEDTMEQARGNLRALNDVLARTIQANAPWQRLVPKILLAVIGLAAVCVIVLSAIVLRDTKRNLQFLSAREMALRQLAATLESRVHRRTRSLTQANQRFDAALRAARVIVFTQDRDLRFTWVSSADPDIAAEDIVGRSNAEIVPNDSIDVVLKIKQQVLVSGEPGHAEVRLAMPGGEKWFDLNVHPLRDAEGEIVGLIGGSVEITQRKEQEARIRLLMREVTHRSKNLLSVIQAIMRQTATHSSSIEDFQKRFADRLHSLAGSHDLLVQENWNGAALRELIRSQLGHYSDLVGSQIRLSGPAVQLRPDAAQHIGMALHELATNAAKYGALSVPSGRVDIRWTVPETSEPAALCHLSWVESNGPEVVPPSRRGFGRVVIERTVARALDGEVEMEYPPGGVRWRLSFPKAAIVMTFPASSARTASTRNTTTAMKNSTRAIDAVAADMPVKPKKPATNETTRKNSAQRNIFSFLSEFRLAAVAAPFEYQRRSELGRCSDALRLPSLRIDLPQADLRKGAALNRRKPPKPDCGHEAPGALNARR